MKCISSILKFLFLGILLQSNLGAVNVDVIPVETLFENTEFKFFDISPDGNNLIAIAPYKGVDNLFIMNLEKMSVQLLTDSERDISSVYWVNDERVVYLMRDRKDDVHSSAGGVMAVNIDGTQSKVLMEPYASQNSNGVTYKGESIGSLSPYWQDDKYVLIESNKRRAKYPDVYLMNVYNGKKKKVFYNPGKIAQFYASPNGRVVFGLEVGEKDEFWKKIYIMDESGEWIEKWHLENSTDQLNILAIEDDSDIALIQHNIGRDKLAVFRYHISEQLMEDEPIVEDDEYDVEPFNVCLSGKSGNVIGLSYDRDLPENRFFSKSFSKLQKQVDEILVGRFNCPVSISHDNKKIVFRSYSDVESPFYNLLDLNTGQFIPLSKSERLDKDALCNTSPVSWKAQDGRTIHGYLTLPKSWKNGNPVPLIVRPHGGPWARETWGLTWYFPMERQFYANRGFAVLEVNFRGSTGYGREFLTSGFKHLKEMNQDFVDGALWAIDQGYANPEKVGIGGASWGGYATMVGVTKYPGIFTFGLNFMGVVDLVEHIDTYLEWGHGRESGFYYWCERIGDPRIETDREMLEEYSPIHFIENIKGPVFVYHGLRDRNVDIEQARMLVRALKANRIEYDEILRVDEAHSVYFEDDRVNTYKEIDLFLKRILDR